MRYIIGFLILLVCYYCMRSRSYKSIDFKLKSQTNPQSRYIAVTEEKMDQLDLFHDAYQCKYTTQDPYFSFEGKPNNYDDFAELHKKNAKHEKHLQERLL